MKYTVETCGKKLAEVCQSKNCHILLQQQNRVDPPFNYLYVETQLLRKGITPWHTFVNNNTEYVFLELTEKPRHRLNVVTGSQNETSVV